MIDSLSPKANLSVLGFLLGILLTSGLSGCASNRRCDENPARVSLEKKIFSLEDQIEAQKRKIQSLQNNLTNKKIITASGQTTDEALENYYEAIRLREAGYYDEAVERLNRFIVENPDHVYSDRAQFLILDSHFRSREFGLVLVDSFALENRYRESRKLPEALYKRGLSYLNLGDKEKGAETLKRVVESFPQSAVSPSAKETLLSLQSSETKE